MTYLWIIFSVVALLFGFVLIFGAPYLPTLAAQQRMVFDTLNLKKGQTFYDLGCGDGRMLRAAAKKGYYAVGYELNPLLAVCAWLSTRRYRGQVRVVCGNFWKADISQADAIFVFLLDRFMPKLDRYIASQHSSGELKVVSYTFAIPGKKLVVKNGPIYLYKY